MAQQNRSPAKSVKLYITCVKGEGKYLKFWAISETSHKAFDSIERSLEEKSAKFETSSAYLRSSQVQYGSLVCVKSEGRGRWCRARVENNPTQYTVTVKLLDYGQEETVAVASVRAFDERFYTEHPPLAIECILGDVAPSYSTEWSPKAIKFCQDHMLNQTMCGFVIAKLDKIPVVRLAKLGQNEPFVQLLINQGLANIEQYEQPRPTAPPKVASSHSPYRSVALDVNAPHLVKISYVDSPERFFVQLSAAELELNNLMNAIEKHVKNERLSLLESPAVNMPCLSPFNSGDTSRRYFRTVITAVEPRTCQVFLVDYGHTETKEYSELKVLPLNFLQLPVQAFKCSLPSGMNVTKEDLVAATNGKHLYCHVLNFNGGAYVVKLSFNNSDLFAMSDSGFSFYNIMHLKIASREEILISYVCSSCEFFCQLETNQLLIKNIQAQLNAENVPQPVSCDDCIAGAPVSVKYSEDGVWYRAKVLHVENRNNIKVTFVDYGNSETTSLCDIRRLPPELAKIPMQALKCTLSGFENVTDPSNSTELFQELIEDKKFTIEILSSTRETGYIVNLYDMSDSSMTLNTKMKQHLLGTQQHMTTRIKPAVPEVQNSRPKLQQYPVETSVPVPTIDRVEKLYISSFTSASLFFGQLNKIDETKLDEMQEEINELYSAAGCSKFIPSVGDVVCAKFSDDGVFYRAKVEECSGDLCKVFFIDFGNRETVDLGDVHKIRPAFTVLPQFGVECALQSCPSADSVQQLKDIMEENVFEFNMLSEKNGKWIVSLTEDFVSNALVLEFLRQHEAPVGYTNQGTKQTEDSETDTWGETSDMNDRRQYRGDGGGRRDPSRSHTSSDRPNKQDYFSERQRSIPSRNFNDNADGSFRNYGERTGGAPRNFGDRNIGAVRNFGGRADGPKKNFADRGDGPPKSFGDRTHVPKKGMDGPNNSPRNFEKSSWDDKSQRFSPKNGYSDNSSTKSHSPQVTEATRTLSRDSVTEVPKLTDYSKVIINNGTYREVYVSHIVNPGEFYCQTTEEKSKMPAMMEKISHKYVAMNDNEQRLTNVFVGQPCCAVYSEDGCWYRGKIIGVDHSSRPSAYDVFFVDYGNAEKVPASKVKCLDSEFFSWPPLALKCALFNILPQGGSWSRDDIKTFMDMALDKCFVAKFEQVDSNGAYLVNLLNINKLQDDIINKDLTIAGHGRIADANKMLVINSQIVSTNLSFAEPNIQDGATEEVIVTWVVNPVEFYCQLESFTPVFTKMMKELQAYYGKTTDIDHVVDRPQPGMICVTQFSEDNAWYRAKVISVEKNFVDVYYVDYGNTEQVTKKKVKYIHQDFTIHPVQGIRCQLEGIRLSGESSISKSVGQKYFGGKTVCTFVRKVDDFFYVTLLNDSKNVAKELLHNDVVLSDSQCDVSAVSTPAISASVSCCILKKQFDTSPGTLLNVVVPFIESPRQFWCHILDSADELEDLMDLIDTRYSSSDAEPLRQIDTGCGCVAQYSKDERWYRAVIKNFNKEMDSYEVFFVDYGNTDIVKSSEVKVIEPEFCALPAQAIECRLHGLPAIISSEATVEFMKVLESEELLAKVESVDNDVLVVTLLDTSGEDEINVGESLFGLIPKNQEVETKVPAFSKPAVHIGVRSGYISCVNDPSDFYVQLEETEEELSDYAASLSEKYECLAETDLVVQGACIGMACCAKFTDDNLWYRAEIIDIAESSATVLFIDYGNTDVVQVHSLKKLTEDLLRKPPYAIHCTLNAVKPLTGNTWSAEAITFFEQTTSDTLLTIKFESQELPVPVILMKDEEEDVAKHLADLQLCQYGKVEVQKTDESVGHHLDTDSHTDITESFKSCHYVERICDVRSTVKLSYAYSLDKFFVTPVNFLEQLELITEKLQELYNNDEESDMSSFITVGLPCAVRYSEDNTWYRALITDIQVNTAMVLFVDYGNSEVADISCLRPLKSELLKVPPGAVECSLFGVKSVSGYQDEITAKLEDFIENEVEFEMEIIEGHQPHNVKLKEERDLADQLVDEGLAEYIHLMSEVEISNNSEKSGSISSSPSVILEKEQIPAETFAQDTVAAVSEGDQAPMQISVQDIPVGKLFVDVKHIEVSNNLIVLHVVPSHQKDALIALQQRLNETYGQSEKHHPCSPSSKYCAAKSSADDCWYRAKILHSNEESYYVSYVDFGNCESVASKSVAELLPEFSNEPQFSISCCMFGIQVAEQDEDDIKNRIFDIIGENCGLLKISCNSSGVFGMCWGLLVVENGDLNVMQILVEEGLARYLWPPVQLPGDEFDAEINSIEMNNSLLLCMIPASWTEEREHFHKDLQEACSVEGDSVFDFKPNVMCAVLCRGAWNRGYVVGSSQEEVVVYLIDSGVAETVLPSSLKPLPSEFCQKAPMVLRCALHNWVFPLTETVREKFYEICASKTAKCKVKDYHSAFEPFYVSLNIEGSDVFSCVMQYVDEESTAAGLSTSLQDALETSQEGDGEYSSLDNFKESAAENFGEDATNSGYPNEDEHFDDARSQIEFETPVEDLSEQHQPAVALNENSEVTVCVQKYPERAVNNKCTVKLGYVYSFDKFYVTPIELQEQLDHITSVLKEQYDLTCESDGQPLCVPCVMQPCVAQYTEDMAWYRAIITDIKANEVSVQFIDFGNTEVVEHDSLKVITPELLKIAPVAVECSLFGIQIIPGKQEEVHSRLMSMLESDAELEMEVIEGHESPYKVRLKGDVDISEQLVNDELCEYYVTPSQKLQDSETFKENLRIAFVEEPLSLEENKGIIAQQNISLGKTFVSVKYVEASSDGIILHVVPDSLKDTLANLQEKLQAVYCNSTCSSLQTSSKFCAARSSEDGVWYRAQLLEQSEEGYNVKFVDYGNCEIVPSSDMRELFPEFIADIQYSVACRLSGVQTIPGKEEAVEERIYGLVSQTRTSVEICDVGLGLTGMCRAALKVDIDSNDVSHILAEDGLVLQVFPSPHFPGTSFKAQIEEIVLDEQLVFYVIPTEWIEARRECQNELLETYKSAEPLTPDAICSNYLYAAMLDKQWYRVSVDTINADSVVVDLVDYGKCETVGKESLQYLEPEFCHKPPFVLSGTLSGWPARVSSAVNEKVVEVCHGKTVTCKLISPNSEQYAVSIETDGDIFSCLAELVGGDSIPESELTSRTNSKTLNSNEDLHQVSGDVTHVSEDAVHEYEPYCNGEEVEEDVENANDSDVEYGSAVVGDCEKAVLSLRVNRLVSTLNDVHDNSAEMDPSCASPQKDSSGSKGVEEVSDLVGGPQLRQTSELVESLCDLTAVSNIQAKHSENCIVGIPAATTTIEDGSLCASAFKESASPDIELTNSEVVKDSSSGPAKEKNLDRLLQNSSVVQTEGLPEMSVKNLISNSVSTESSSSLEESSQGNTIEDDSPSIHIKQLNQNVLIDELP